MSKKVEFFVLTFTSKDKDDKNIYSGNFKNFFEKIEEIFAMADKSKILYRDIGGKKITISRFLRNDSNYFLIPFGKLKEGKAYTQKDDIFTELNTELFEVSSMVFNITNNVAIITKNKMGPNFTLIEEYLNSFIPADFDYEIKIIPLFEDNGLSKLKNAKYVKSIIIELRISDAVKSLYANRFRSQKGHINSFIAYSANDIKSESIKLELGFNYAKKKDSLDIDCVYQLIEDLKLNPDIIKQIRLKYVTPQGDNDYAELKDSNIIVSHTFGIRDNFLPSEYLLNSCNEAFEGKVNKYRKQRISIQAAEISMPTELRELCLDWNPEEYYDN